MQWIFISGRYKGNKYSGNLIKWTGWCILKLVLAKCRGMGNEPTYVSTKLMDLLWDYIKKVSVGGVFSSSENEKDN